MRLRLLSILIFAVAIAAGAAEAGKAGVEKIPGGAKIGLEDGALSVYALTENIIRVRFVPGGGNEGKASLIVMDRKSAPPMVAVSESETSVKIETGKIAAEISMTTGAVTFYDPAGTKLLMEAENGRVMVPASADGDKFYNAGIVFAKAAGDGLYGLGQYQDGMMNRRGGDVFIAQANMEIAIPFLLSTAGYGILWDNYSMTKFHDGKDGTSFWSEAADAIDYYFVYGPSADEVIAGYRELTGAAPMVPKWACGYMQSKERYKTRDELISIVKEYRERKLPLDTIILDWQYWGKYGWSALKFDEDIFPDPAGMIDIIHKDNAHIMISIWPKFAPESDVFKEMESKGFLYPLEGEGGARTYDAFSEEARRIYWKHADAGIFSKGMDSWWMDATEPEIKSARTQELQTEAMKSAGMTALGSSTRLLNAFSLMTAKGFYENQRAQSDKRVVILTRSSFAGQQRYSAAAWSGDIEGDWRTFEKQIPAGLNFSMSGNPYWTTDIGGFFVRYAGGSLNEEYRELYVRWFQFGAFCPLFRSHGTHTPREIWRFGEPGEWAFEALKKFDNLRYRLMPYIYSLTWKVTDEGYTPMRGLAMDFPGDDNVMNIADQYMFGPAFLVNPVTRAMYRKEKLNSVSKMLKEMKSEVKTEIVVNTKTRSRDVYLPAGAGWYDFWTGEKLEGGKSIQAPAPVDIMPLFVRAGSIVPMGPFLQYATEKPADPVELRIYPGADASFTIYEDENDNYNYEKGAHTTIRMDWNDAARRLTIGEVKGSFPGMLKDRTFNAVIIRQGTGAGVEPVAQPDKTIRYSGKEIAVEFGDVK